MKFKITAGFVLLSFVGILGLMLYDISQMDSETIILCASNEGGILIPSKACEYYLYNHRNLEKDVIELSGGAGLGFILSGNNEEKKYKIAELFISNGLDINGANRYGNHNLTPIYDAILLNDVTMASFLLKNNARLDAKLQSVGMTPLEFARSLQEKEPQVDRKELIKMLSN